MAAIKSYWGRIRGTRQMEMLLVRGETVKVVGLARTLPLRDFEGLIEIPSPEECSAIAEAKYAIAGGEVSP